MAERHPIRFGVQTGQQNVSWAELTELWSKADGWGYDSLWVFDHFYPIFTPDPAGPCMEGWTLLSALSQNIDPPLRAFGVALWRARIGRAQGSAVVYWPLL